MRQRLKQGPAPPGCRSEGEGTLLLTFDVEELDLAAHLRPVLPFTDDDLSHHSRLGALAIAGLCADTGLQATCFVTGSFARSQPEVVRALAGAGLEIACHGQVHADDYPAFYYETLVQKLFRAREELEALAGRPVLGHRSPRFSPVAPQVLRRAGFVYDSSIHPTLVPGRYNGLLEPRRPFWRGSLLEIPPTVVPLVRLPLSWLWLRAMPEPLHRALCGLSAWACPVVCLYVHCWELASPQTARHPLASLLMHGTGPQLRERLVRLIRWSRARGLRDRTMRWFADRFR